MQSVRVVTEPTVEPITLTDAKLHLREDGTGQDDLISAIIKVARQYAEAYTGRAFVERTLELSLDAFPASGEILLPRPPLLLVESVKYTDEDGAEQTVSDALYQVDPYSTPGRLKPVYGETWPTVKGDTYNAVRVRYTAGYAEIGSPSGGDLTNGIPEPIKQWMRVRVAQHYEHREAVIAGTIVAPLPKDFVDGLLDPYRVKVV